MENVEYSTEEVAELVPVMDLEDGPENTLEAANARIAALEAENAALNAEAFEIAKTYDEEVTDHAETTKKWNAAEKHLYHMYSIWASELGCSVSQLDGDDEVDLQAAIKAAATRIENAKKHQAERDAMMAGFTASSVTLAP